MKRILVVCTANSCRSQMGEAYLRFFAGEQVEVVSAGLFPQAIHPLTKVVLEEDNIDLGAAYSKPITDFSGQSFDFVLTICEEVRPHIPQFIFCDARAHMPVDDPAQVEGDTEIQLEAFRNCREEIKRLMLRFIGQNLLLAEIAV